MACYNLIFKPSVEKDFRRLPKPVVPRVMERMESLRDNPLPHQSLKLAGAEQLYRVRVGDYRVVYGVDHDAKQVIIHHVRHRREVYRGL